MIYFSAWCMVWTRYLSETWTKFESHRVQSWSFSWISTKIVKNKRRHEIDPTGLVFQSLGTQRRWASTSKGLSHRTWNTKCKMIANVKWIFHIQARTRSLEMTHLSNRHSVTFNPRSNDARAAANASAILSKTPERKKKNRYNHSRKYRCRLFRVWFVWCALKAKTWIVSFAAVYWFLYVIRQGESV